MLLISKLTLLPLAILTSSTTAQNSTSNNTCTPILKFDGPLNASALVEIPSSGTPPWYLTVTLGDKRTNTTADHTIYGFRSTPANSSAYACFQLLRTILPDTGTGANGNCAGILSDSCVDFLKKHYTLSESDVQSGRCPDLPSRDEIGAACSPLKNGFGGGGTGPSRVSNSSCPDSRVPGPDQPPSDYDNSGLFGVSGFGSDESDRADPSKFTWYDKYASRPTLWTVAARENGNSWASVVCATPNKIAEGSRKPSESAGVSVVGTKGGAWAAVAIAVAVAVVI